MKLSLSFLLFILLVGTCVSQPVKFFLEFESNKGLNKISNPYEPFSIFPYKNRLFKYVPWGFQHSNISIGAEKDLNEMKLTGILTMGEISYGYTYSVSGSVLSGSNDTNKVVVINSQDKGYNVVKLGATLSTRLKKCYHFDFGLGANLVLLRKIPGGYSSFDNYIVDSFLNDTVTHESTHIVKSKVGVTIRLQYSKYFLIKGKERVSLNFYLDQGFITMIKQNLFFENRVESTEKWFNIRGSSIGFAVRIPIYQMKKPTYSG